jgi:hypothetical protein
LGVALKSKQENEHNRPEELGSKRSTANSKELIRVHSHTKCLSLGGMNSTFFHTRAVAGALQNALRVGEETDITLGRLNCTPP